MNIEDKTKALAEIYAEFERTVAEFKKTAVCEIGCANCCTHVGNVDITTLEGLVIQKRLNAFDKTLKNEVRNRLAHNKTERERGKLAKCAFLKEENTCLIYDIRPFSCRRLYSIKLCNGNQPVVHRQALALADQTIQKLQRLDDTGYTGHMSFILYLLEEASFRKTYLSDLFDPSKIMAFGKSHGIIINRFMNRP